MYGEFLGVSNFGFIQVNRNSVQLQFDRIAKLLKAKLLLRFVLLEIYPDFLVYRSANTERINICSVILWICQGKCIYTVT